MGISRAFVEETAKAAFPNLALSVVMSILDEYGERSHEQTDRVHLAILKLSAGDEGKLLDYVLAAQRDFRDVLVWAEVPEPTPEQSAAELSIAERILKAYGRK